MDVSLFLTGGPRTSPPFGAWPLASDCGVSRGDQVGMPHCRSAARSDLAVRVRPTRPCPPTIRSALVSPITSRWLVFSLAAAAAGPASSDSDSRMNSSETKPTRLVTRRVRARALWAVRDRPVTRHARFISRERSIPGAVLVHAGRPAGSCLPCARVPAGC